MALTITSVRKSKVDRESVRDGSIAFDDSYPTGGEALVAATLNLTEIYNIQIQPTSGYVFEYDYTNEKIKAYWVDTTVDGAPLAEVVNTTDLVALTAVRFRAFGH